MKSTKYSRFTRAAISLLAGFSIFQFGSCTTQNVKTQFANGLSGVVTGLFSIAVSDASNELFDVDD